MLPLSSNAILEKNKLASDGAYLILLEIQIPGTETIRVLRNTENKTWGGHEWVAFSFEMDDIVEDGKGELPQVILRVSNVTQGLEPYLQTGNGGVGATVIIRVVNSNYLSEANPDVEISFICESTDSDENWVYFTLGGGDAQNRRIPIYRYFKDSCRFSYGGVECGATAAVQITYPNCNGTLNNCRIRGNSIRFGGCPSIPSGGLYV